MKIDTADKILLISYTTSAGVEWICRVGLDSGLLMEAQALRNGEMLFMMYTELFDLAPEEFLQNDFFTIPRTEEQNQ